MANPTPGDVHVNAPLTNISVAWFQSQSAYVSHQVFPVVPVEKQSDLYYKYDKGDLLRDEAKPRAPASESAGGGFKVSTDNYACTVDAFHKDVDDQMRANADSILQLDRAATEYVTQKLALRRERQWTNTFFKTGVWATDATPATLWSAANSKPKRDVEAGKTAILKATGFQANTMVMGYEVFSMLTDHADIREQFKYTSADSIDLAMMARYFGVERVLVMAGIYANSVEGASTTTDFIAGKHVLLCHSASAPSLMTPTAGYTFAWSGYTGAVEGTRIKRFRMEHLSSDRIEGEQAFCQKIVCSEMGYFLSGVVS